MPRLNFSNASTRSVFENVDYDGFKTLMENTAAGHFQQGITKDEANNKIREVMFAVLGVDENADKKEIRKAIRRHKVDVYEVIEEVVPDLLNSGWIDNPWFNQFVDYRNLASGDTNEFYVEDDVILTVAKIAGNHHSMIRQRLGGGESFQVATSWFGVKSSSLTLKSVC